MEEIDEVPLDPANPNHIVFIGSRLEANHRQYLVNFLLEHNDYFGWTHEDMTGTDPSIITYQLKVDPAHSHVK